MQSLYCAVTVIPLGTKDDVLTLTIGPAEGGMEFSELWDSSFASNIKLFDRPQGVFFGTGENSPVKLDPAVEFAELALNTFLDRATSPDAPNLGDRLDHKVAVVRRLLASDDVMHSVARAITSLPVIFGRDVLSIREISRLLGPDHPCPNIVTIDVVVLAENVDALDLLRVRTLAPENFSAIMQSVKRFFATKLDDRSRQ